MIEVLIRLKDKTKSTRTAKTLFRLNISNDGSGTEENGLYNAALYSGLYGRIIGSCKVRNFPRDKLTAYHLVKMCLDKIVNKEPNVRNSETIEGAVEQAILREISAQTASTSI